MKIRGTALRKSRSDDLYALTRPIRVEELELAPPGPTEVLVRIEVAGICPFDPCVVNGSRPRNLPMLIRHEAVGLVVAVGSQTSTILSTGVL